MRKALFLALLLTFCASCSNAETATHEQVQHETRLEAHRLERPAGPLLDAAGILDANQEARLSDQLTGFNQRTGQALVVVTVGTLGGEAIEDYTLELARRWGVGGAETQDGVVLLVAPNERKVRVETTDSLRYGKLPDELCAQIIRENILPHFGRGELVTGIREGVNALSAAMSRS